VSGLTLAFALAAFLFASVGHAGASAYLVAMALAGMDPAVMKPTALMLNLVVGTIALVQFARAGRFSWRLFWPFALGSAPFALLGGALTIHATVFRALVAVALLAAALRLALPERGGAHQPVRPVPVGTAIAIGAAIGLLAGVTGTGGGIYLSPVLIFFRWAEGRDTGGVAAAFILVNSVAGLLGNQPNLSALPPELPLWALVVAVSGFCGSWVGSRYATPPVFKRLVAAVLLIAAVKLVAT
jgi:hypothetical protein